MNKLTRYTTAVCLGMLALGCDNDENTGNSTLIKTNPAITIDIANPVVAFVEKDSTFEYTVTLSTPQIVNVSVNVLAIDGTATEGEDFTVEGGVIPAGKTSTVVKVKVNSDDTPEDTETFTIQIGDAGTANAQIAPKTISFTIQNVFEGDLHLGLSWAAVFTDATGTQVPPADIADMIFYLTDLDGDVELDADGGSFESLLVSESLADGEYLIKAGIYAAIDPGDLGEHPVLDLSLTYSQAGKISETTIPFPKAFDTQNVCEDYLYTLAKLVKDGTNYTITVVAEVTPGCN